MRNQIMKKALLLALGLALFHAIQAIAQETPQVPVDTSSCI